MIINCEKCKTSHEVKETDIGENGLGLTCSSCQHQFRLVRKVFYLVEDLKEEHNLTPQKAVAASPEQVEQEKQKTQEPEIRPQSRGPDTTMRGKIPPKKIPLNLPTRPVESSSKVFTLRFMLLLALTLGMGWVWLRVVHPDAFKKTVGKMEINPQNFLQNIQPKVDLPSPGKKDYLQGRGIAVFDTPDKYKLAIQFYRKAIEKDENLDSAHGALAEASAELAEYFSKKGKEKEAKKWLEETLRSATRSVTLNNHSIEGHRGLAAYERLKGNFVESQEHLNQVMISDPEDVEIYISMGRNYLMKQGLEEMAEKYLKKALQINERSIRANRYMAVVYERIKKYDLSVAHWQKVLDLNQAHQLAKFEMDRIKFKSTGKNPQYPSSQVGQVSKGKIQEPPMEPIPE